MKSEYLVLFDIDGTLLNVEKLHAKTYQAVFRNIFGTTNIQHWPDFSGRTELWLIRKLAEINGISNKKITSHLLNVINYMGEYYAGHIDEEIGQLTAGIENLLKELDRRKIIRGIVTGNIQRIADLKLEHFGISEGFELREYGSTHEDRAVLLQKAKFEALRKFPHLDKNKIIYVGDTPLDIKTAHQAGIRALAVKTNPNHKYSFNTVKPGLVMDTLENIPLFFDYLYQTQ